MTVYWAPVKTQSLSEVSHVKNRGRYSLLLAITGILHILQLVNRVIELHGPVDSELSICSPVLLLFSRLPPKSDLLSAIFQALHQVFDAGEIGIVVSFQQVKKLGS